MARPAGLARPAVTNLPAVPTIVPLIAYADLEQHPLVSALLDIEAGDTGDAAQRAARFLFASPMSPGEAVAHAVLSSDGPFAVAAHHGMAPADGRLAVASRELARLSKLAAGARSVLAGAGVRVDDGTSAAAPWESAAAAALRVQMAGDRAWGAHAEAVADFHATQGVGDLATHRVLRFHDGRLEGVARPDEVGMADLIGGRPRRVPLETAIASFARGGPAVDALLYGPPGTGKSATVRALAHALVPEGLRLVQVARGELDRLPDLFSRVAGAGPRCLVLLDDLVFDEAGRGDRDLRAALEGDVAARPPNVAVWATSNRMRLVHETHATRDDDIEESLGRGERAALASRFALRVHVPPLGQDEFCRMAVELARRQGRDLGAGGTAAAARFGREHSLTPRSAHHFAALAEAG